MSHSASLSVWPASLSMTHSGSILVSANGIISFLVMTESYSMICMYHIFFIHSSVSGHLGGFHVLAIVNSAAVIIGVHVSFGIMVFLWIYAQEWDAGSYGSSIFSFFKGVSILISIVATPIYVLTSSIGGFPSLHTLPSIYCFWVFDDSHFGQCEMRSHCSFWFAFLS